MEIRRLATLFFFICIVFSATAQSETEKKIDSLLQVVEGKERLDTTAFDALRYLARYSREPEKSKEYALDLLARARETENSSGLYNAYLFLGTAETRLGNTSAGLEAYFESLKHTSKPYIISETYTSIGDTYTVAEDMDNAILYYNKAIDILKEIELDLRQKASLATAYLNAGDTYFLMGENPQALAYFEQSGVLFKEIGDQQALAYNQGNIGLVQAALGNHVLAESNIDSAVSYLLTIDDYYAVSIYYTYMADLYVGKNEFPRAIQYAKESYQMARDYGLKEQIRDASYKLFELYRMQDLVDSALAYHMEYVQYKDSITNREVIQQMANQRTEFEVGQKQIEVDLANQQKENRQILAIAMGVVALLAAIFLVNFYLAYQNRKKLSLKLEALNATKDKFFSIVSHDLRGPISAFSGISNIIRGYLRQKSYDELEEMTDLIDKSANSISDLLDNLLNWAVQQQGQVPYNPAPVDLNQMLDTTLGIFETAATAKDIVLSNDIGRSLFVVVDKDTIMTIFRNLVGNALKFTQPGGKIWVEAETKDARIHVKVNDTGIGMSEEQVEKLFSLKEKRSYGTEGETGLGVGLQLVKEFVALNNGDLQVESKEGEGTCFTVSLPVPDVNELK